MLPWVRCHSVSFVMYVSGASLKNTAPIFFFLEIFLIEYCTVLVEPPMTSSLSSIT